MDFLVQFQLHVRYPKNVFSQGVLRLNRLKGLILKDRNNFVYLQKACWDTGFG